MNKFLSLITLSIVSTTAFAADFVPYEKTYRTPDGALVKVVETKSRNGKLRCHIGEVPVDGGMNVLENQGWIECDELVVARGGRGNGSVKKGQEHPYAQDADDLNESGEREQLSR